MLTAEEESPAFRKNSRVRPAGTPWVSVDEDYHALATERGFHWLGPEVHTAHDKTSWRCEEGHQWEAAYSLGLSTFSLYKDIILPQAMRRILPPLTGQAISLIKDSSLVSVIAVYEMTMQANAIVAETFLVFEIYFSIAVIYLILTVSLSQLVNYMERRIKIV